jgi:multidrug efflux pump subunit AcrA (membrane-fusion protein)
LPYLKLLEILIDAQQPVVLAPASAIVTFAGIEKVLAEKQGRAIERRIRTGRRAGDRVEVLEGVAPGDLIVAEPGNLTGGEPVSVKQ